MRLKAAPEDCGTAIARAIAGRGIARGRGCRGLSNRRARLLSHGASHDVVPTPVGRDHEHDFLSQNSKRRGARSRGSLRVRFQAHPYEKMLCDQVIDGLSHGIHRNCTRRVACKSTALRISSEATWRHGPRCMRASRSRPRRSIHPRAERSRGLPVEPARDHFSIVARRRWQMARRRGRLADRGGPMGDGGDEALRHVVHVDMMDGSLPVIGQGDGHSAGQV